MKAGLFFSIKDYAGMIEEDKIQVWRQTQDELTPVTEQTITNYGTSILELMSRPGARVGWAAFDDFEVIYLYDKGDDNFGYAVNLTDEWCSEWGFSPF